MDGGESAGAGAHLLGTGSAGGLGHDAALSNEDNVAVRELLLELTGEAALDLVESLQLGDGDEDDNGLLAVAGLDLKK